MPYTSLVTKFASLCTHKKIENICKNLYISYGDFVDSQTTVCCQSIILYNVADLLLACLLITSGFHMEGEGLGWVFAPSPLLPI